MIDPACVERTYTHEHDDDRLVIGCPGCIGATRDAEFAASVKEMTLDEILDRLVASDGPPTYEREPWEWHLLEVELRERYGQHFGEVLEP